MPFISIAQPYVDILNVKSQYFLKTNYADSTNNKLVSNQQEATFLIPLVLKNKDIIYIGGDYTQLNFSSSGKSNEYGHLQTVSLQLGYEKGWKNEKWRTFAMVIPKINSDLGYIHSNDFQLGGVVLFKYQKKENLSYHIGAYYNREFFGNYFLPLLGIDWRINKRLNLFGDFPASMNLEYKFGKSFYGGAEFYCVVSSYRTETTILTNDYIREGDKIFGHEEFRIYLHAYLSSHLVLSAQTGETFYRVFEQYDSKNDPARAGSNSIYRKTKDQLFFNIGIAYRFRLDTEKNSTTKP